jgi:hypothetical protein
MIICRKDAKGEAGFSRMPGGHSRRRTGATGFVAPRVAIKQKPLRSLMRAIPGAPPAGALRASNFVPDKIVRQIII